MGLWDRFVSWLDPEEDDDDLASRLRRYGAPDPSPPNWPPSRPSDIVVGRVEYIASKFAKLQGAWGNGVLFPREAAHHYVESMFDVFSQGDRVEVVLLERSAKNPDEWILSVRAVERVRARAAFEAMAEGERRIATVERVEPQRVQVDVAGLRGFIRIADLRHEVLETCLGVVHEGDELEVEIVRLVEAGGDNPNGRPHAQCSARRCLPEPPVTKVSIRLGVVPFVVHARPNLPRRFDRVARFVLEERVAGATVAQLAEHTALPVTALEELVSLLKDLRLVSESGEPSPRGRSMVEAIRLAEAVEDAGIAGVFASAAPPELAFSPRDDTRVAEWPSGFPRPLVVPRVERNFQMASEEDLQGQLPLEALASKHDLATLQPAFDHPLLRVRIRQARDNPARAALYDVDEQWILGLLWRALEPLDDPPPPRITGRGSARAMHLVKLELRDEGLDARHLVYWEPVTDTLWRPRDQAPRLTRLRAPTVPAPDDLAMRLGRENGDRFRLVDRSWVVLKPEQRKGARRRG